MDYAQLNEAGTEAIQVVTHGNIEWDAHNFCSAEALIKDGKADQFRVVELTETTMPVFDPSTHKCFHDGCEKVGDAWQYKWTLIPLTETEIDAAYQASVPQEISRAQFILALLHTLPDLLDAVEAAIANADRATQINYKERLTFRRDFPLVATMATALGKTDLEIDAIFILGATL